MGASEGSGDLRGDLVVGVVVGVVADRPPDHLRLSLPEQVVVLRSELGGNAGEVVVVRGGLEGEECQRMTRNQEGSI